MISNPVGIAKSLIVVIISLLFLAEFRAVRGNEPGPGLRTVAPGTPAARLCGRKRQSSGKMDDGAPRSRQLRVQSFVGVAASSFACAHPPESHLPEQQSFIGDAFLRVNHFLQHSEHSSFATAVIGRRSVIL
jgi:hypothetical protein